jgi:prepilin-type N-terminal cleavage/methylation domain-containing protein
MKKGNNSGFTLVEVVVVVAVIAILAAVLTPYITKYIDDSKIAKAKNECQVISASVANFFKDTGGWPRTPWNGAAISVFYTGTQLPNTYAAFVNGAGVTAGWNVNVAQLDPKFGPTAPAGYPTTGEMRWNGPYASGPLPLDPWGRPYLVYVPAAAAGNAAPIWIISAGPNQRMDTQPTAPSIVPGTMVNGQPQDDIGIRVR